MRFALVARRSTSTNDALSAVVVDDARWETISPEVALNTLRAGDSLSAVSTPSPRSMASTTGSGRSGARSGWTVLEVNGAVEFTEEYAPSGESSRTPRRSSFTPRWARISMSRSWLRPDLDAIFSLLHSGARGGVAQLVRAPDS